MEYYIGQYKLAETQRLFKRTRLFSTIVITSNQNAENGEHEAKDENEEQRVGGGKDEASNNHGFTII